MKKPRKQGITIKYLYELLGVYCLVWLLVGIFRTVWSFEYMTMIGSEPSLWTVYALNKIIIYLWISSYLIFPWLIRSKLRRLISVDSKSLTAGLTLNGCCMGIICLKCISIHLSLSASACFCILLAGLIISYIVGHTAAYPSKCFSHVNDKFRYSLLSSIIYGLTAALSAYFLAPFWITGISDESVLICTGAAFAVSSVAYILIEKLLAIHSRHIRDSFAEEMDKIRSDIEAFDKKVAKAAAERKAKEEQTRREQAAREQAERARKAREQAEKDRQTREKAERNRHSHNSASGSPTYFSGITSKAELKRRYRQLCKKLHPDCPGGNAESFRQMQSEYTRLNSRLAS